MEGQAEHRQSDVLDPARASALWATLGQDRQVQPGDALPPFFHQIYFWDAQVPPRLGRDGHPKVGGLIPDMGLPRRMWAGGTLTFHAPLRAGQVAEKVTRVAETARKDGRTGPLGFVTLEHQVWQGGALCVTERQNLVYREEATPGGAMPAPPKATQEPETRSEITPSSTELFRYSALTFNGHRIHYDTEYAQQVEGYDHLVVHGPLLAQYLMLKAEAELGPLRSFTFRGTSALTLGKAATLCRGGHTLWVESADRQLHMTAEAEPLEGGG